MGFFSFITSDTNKSISNHYSSRKPFTVHLITEDGQVFTEKNYEGYGDFGGKDIYELTAQLNGFKTRDDFFDKIWIRGITKDDKKLIFRQDFSHYEQPIPSENNLTPNQLTNDGWTNFGDNGGFEYWASQGFKMPKIVEVLHKQPNDPNWKEYWNSLPYPKDCPEQGFFY